MKKRPKTDAQEHLEAMEARRFRRESWRQEKKDKDSEGCESSIEIVNCCSCHWPTDKKDGHNTKIGATGVKCLTCSEKGKAGHA